jgi:hypothetical protein
MHRFPGPGNGNFYAVDETHAQLLCGLLRLRQAADLIVIGQGQDIHAIGVGALHQRMRRKHAVRDGGMAMQIDVQGTGVHKSIVKPPNRRRQIHGKRLTLATFQKHRNRFNLLRRHQSGCMTDSGHRMKARPRIALHHFPCRVEVSKSDCLPRTIRIGQSTASYDCHKICWPAANSVDV